jgi:glycosyltransferase involved in cell wall biosynthesis
MRIAHVAPRGEQPWSGVLTVIVQLAAALARRGHGVEVCQLHEWETSLFSEHIAELDRSGVHQIRIHEGSWWRLGQEVSRVVRANGAQLVHLHGGFNVSNTAVARALDLPYVFSPHSAYERVSLTRGRVRKAAYRMLFERTMLRRASLVTALTSAELDDVKAFGAPGPFAIIPNGVTSSPPEADRASVRQNLGVRGDRRVVVFVGRLDVWRKGLDRLIAGVAEAPEWHLAVIGPDHRGGLARLRDMVRNHHIVDRVSLCGPLLGRRLQDTLAAADLFALMSRWEGLPMALLEALSHGTPAVVSPEVDRCVGVGAAGAGWSASSESLGGTLRSLTSMEDLQWADYSRAAKQLSRRYDWEAVADQYESAYERVLGS